MDYRILDRLKSKLVTFQSCCVPTGSANIFLQAISSLARFSALRKMPSTNDNITARIASKVCVSSNVLDLVKTFSLTLTDMMINKDNAEIISDDYVTSKEGPISFYIPRTAPMNGKKRGAILSWDLPSSRM